MFYKYNNINSIFEHFIDENIRKSLFNGFKIKTCDLMNNSLSTLNPNDIDYVQRSVDEIIQNAIGTIDNGMISTDILRSRSNIKMAVKDTPCNVDNDGVNNIEKNSKPEVKKKVRKFKIGERYLIYPMNNKKLRREFVVKKTIYNIKGKEVNIVIMKQISGSESTKFTLSKEDCLKFHLKFEEGLQVFSMELDWKLVKK